MEPETKTFLTLLGGLGIGIVVGLVIGKKSVSAQDTTYQAINEPLDTSYTCESY